MPTVDVSSIITGLKPIRHHSSYTMPVLSPRHSSSSTLTGSYRSTFSSSSVDRPYYSSSTNSYTSPRLNYSERFTSRTYSTDDGKKLYSRHTSITEDGITSRFREREESREKSVRRESLSRDLSRDSGFRDSSTRSNSLRDNSLVRDRDLSLTRDSSSRSNLSTMSVIESVADLRSKYSPANYVPAVLRGKDNISRSKSINDIGRPPIEREIKIKSKKVTENGVNGVHCNGVALTNNTNDKLDNNVTTENDNNGNRASVAEIRKKFDPNYTRKLSNIFVEGSSLKCSERQKTPKGTEKDTKETNSVSNLTNEVVSEKRAQKMNEIDTITPIFTSGSKFFNRPAKFFKSNDLEQDILKTKNNSEDVNSVITENGENETSNEISDNGETWTENSSMEISDSSKLHNHTSNFASYIPSKEFNSGENLEKNEVSMNDSEDLDMENNATNAQTFNQRILNVNNDISTSPRLNRAAIAQNASNSSSQPSASNNISSLGTNQRSSPSVERERNRDDDRNFDRPFGSNPTRNSGLNGLKNIGNTCFMNSVIQCLSNTRYLLEYVKEDAYLEDINTSISSMKGALIKAFSQVIQELWSPDSSDRVVNTLALKSQIQRFAPRFMGYAQQDAQEFLRYLLEGLHEDVNRVTQKPAPILTEIDEKLSDSQKASEAWQRYLRMDNSRVVDIFVGQLKSTLRCTHCGHCSVTFDPFWDLSLPIPQRSGQLRLSQCLEYFTREETMDGDEKPTCSRCKERRKCTKSFTIQKFPKILVIHLKRFSPTERFRGKLSLVIDFPLSGLDLSAYAANKGSTECLYTLYAVSNHSGTTYSGHYTAYCKHPYTQQWHEYNDSRVSSISPKNIVSSEAYVLFYELVGQHAHL